MSDKKLKQRSDIPKQYKWNIEAMYPDESQWEKDIDDCLSRAEKFGDYRGRLTRSAATLLEALKERDDIWQKIEHAYVYAAMQISGNGRQMRERPCQDSRIHVLFHT